MAEKSWDNVVMGSSGLTPFLFGDGTTMIKDLTDIEPASVTM